MGAQWCLILCNPTDCSPPGSSVHGYTSVQNKNTYIKKLCACMHFHFVHFHYVHVCTSLCLTSQLYVIILCRYKIIIYTVKLIMFPL